MISDYFVILTWWYFPAVPNPVHDDKWNVVAIPLTASSITLLWQQQPDLPLDVLDPGSYYGYRVWYKDSSSPEYTVHNRHSHDPDRTYLKQEVTGLKCGTTYMFRVDPYREWQGVRDYGSPYPTVMETPRCENNNI